MIKSLMDYFGKPKSEVEEFETLWNNLQSLCESLHKKTTDNNSVLNPKLHVYLSNFVDKLREEDEKLPTWDMGDCLEHALKNDYFTSLVAYAKSDKPKGMFTLVTLKLALLAKETKGHKIISYSGFLFPLVKLVKHAQDLMAKEYDSHKANALVFLFNILARIFVKCKGVLEAFYVGPSIGNSHTKGHFMPLKILEEIMKVDTKCDSKLCGMVLNYTLYEIKDYQNYLNTNSTLPITIAECFGKYYLTLFSQTPLTDKIQFQGWRHCLAGKMLSTLPEENHTDYYSFVNFVKFIDQIYTCHFNNTFLEMLSKSIFNLVLTPLFQNQILSDPNSAVSRSAIQYLTLILENITSPKFAQCIFNFLFGFRDVPLQSEINPCSPPQEYKLISHYKCGSSSTTISPVSETSKRKDSKSCERTVSRFSVGELDPDSGSENLDEPPENEEYGGKQLPYIEEAKFSVSPSKRKGYYSSFSSREYIKKMHKPKDLTNYIFTKLKVENNPYSVIVWQLLTKFLSFQLNDFIKLFITDYIKTSAKNLWKTRRVTAQQILVLFPNYTAACKDLHKSRYHDFCFERVHVFILYKALPLCFAEEDKNSQLREDMHSYYRSIMRKTKVRSSIEPPLSKLQSEIYRNTLGTIGRHTHTMSMSHAGRSRISHTRQKSGTAAYPLTEVPAKKSLIPEVAGEYPSYGKELISILFQKLKTFLTNSFEENLFLADFIIKLMSVPTYVNSEESFLLHYFLVEPSDNPVVKEDSLLTILIELAEKIEKSGGPGDLKPAVRTHVRAKTHFELPNKSVPSKRVVDARIIFEELIKEYCTVVSTKNVFDSITLSAVKTYLECETRTEEIVNEEYGRIFD